MNNSNQVRMSTGAWIFLSVVLVMGTIVALVIMNNNSQQEKNAQTQSDKETNARLYNECVTVAREGYDKQWEETSVDNGSNDGTLSKDAAEFLDNRLKELNEECSRRYNR